MVKKHNPEPLFSLAERITFATCKAEMSSIVIQKCVNLPRTISQTRGAAAAALCAKIPCRLQRFLSRLAAAYRDVLYFRHSSTKKKIAEEIAGVGLDVSAYENMLDIFNDGFDVSRLW